MLKKLKLVGEYVGAAILVAALLFVGLLFLRFLGELWPVFTTAFYLFMTIGGLAKGNWVMSLGGLSLYISSWTAVSEYGLLVGMTICFVGLVMWFVAPFITLSKKVS